MTAIIIIGFICGYVIIAGIINQILSKYFDFSESDATIFSAFWVVTMVVTMPFLAVVGFGTVLFKFGFKFGGFLFGLPKLVTKTFRATKKTKKKKLKAKLIIPKERPVYITSEDYRDLKEIISDYEQNLPIMER